MVTVNSIFAGFSGALMVAIFRANESQTATPEVSRCLERILSMQPAETVALATHVGAAFAIVGLFLFALAAEWITDALDEGSVGKYLRSMQSHNVGVCLVAVALACVIYVNGGTWWTLIFPLLFALKWLKDFVELLSPKGRTEYQALINVDE